MRTLLAYNSNFYEKLLISTQTPIIPENEYEIENRTKK